MSQENVETLQAVYAAFNAGKGIDLDLLTPDVEFTQPEIGESAYFGRDGVERGVRELDENDGSGALGGCLRVIVPTDLLKTPAFMGFMETVVCGST